MAKKRELHIRDYVNVLRKRKYAVFTVFVVIFAIFLLGTTSQQDYYIATTKVLIERNEPRVFMMNFYYTQSYDPEFYSTQYQFIKSTSVGARVVEKLALVNNYDLYFSEEQNKASEGPFDLSRLRALPPVKWAENTRAVRWLKGALGFETGGAGSAGGSRTREVAIDLTGLKDGGEVSAKDGDFEFTIGVMNKGLLKDEGLSKVVSSRDRKNNRYYLLRIKAVAGCIPEDLTGRIRDALRFTARSEGSVTDRAPELVSASKKVVYEDDACGKGRRGAVLYKEVLSVGRDFAPEGLAVELSARGAGAKDDASREKTPELSPEEKKHHLAKMISTGIIISPITNSRIVNIGFKSSNPKLAARIANTVAEAYIDYIFEMKMNSSRHKLKWLTAKSQEEKNKLKKSEKALQRYMKNNDIITLENRIAIIPARLAEFGSQHIKAETRRKELEALYLKVSSSGDDIEYIESIPVIASRPGIILLRNEINNAEQNILELSKKYGKKHPVKIAAVEELEVLKKRRKDELRRAIKAIETEYDLARTNEANLEGLLARTKREVLDVNEKFIQYGALLRDVETNKQLYYAIIKNIKERDIVEEMQTVDVWVVEKAEIPKKPIMPQKGYNVLVGLILGLVGGIGMAFFVEYLDNTVKTPDELEAKLEMPVLGMVSFIKPKERIEGIVNKEPRSIVSENYKSIRTALLLSSGDTPPKNILISSASPREGKTVTAINLAETIAQSEYSVLLVDSDLRKPRVHKIYGIDNSKGLSTYLAGVSELEILQPESQSNLRILPSGPIPPNPSELLTSNRLNEMLRAVSGMFDFTIWDSPPLMSVTDGLMLSKRLDGTVLVSWAGRTTYDELRRAIKSLEDIQSVITGIIINAVDLRKSHYYDYKYYNYYYSDKKT